MDKQIENQSENLNGEGTGTFAGADSGADTGAVTGTDTGAVTGADTGADTGAVTWVGSFINVVKRYIVAFISGIGCGAAVALPGVSWGTILVITGYYELICDVLALKFKIIWKNKFALLILFFGLILGLFGLSHLIRFVLERSPLIFSIILAALVSISIPSIIKRVCREATPGYIHIIPALTGFTVVTVLFLMEIFEVSGLSGTPGPFRISAYSAVAGFSSIIPGISGSLVLTILGTYEMVITAVSDLSLYIFGILGIGEGVPDLGFLYVFGFAVIGMVTGFVGGSRIISYLLKRARATVYFAVIGMMMSSVVMIIIKAVIEYA